MSEEIELKVKSAVAEQLDVDIDDTLMYALC